MPEVDPEHMNVASQTADKQPFAVNTYSYTLTHGAAACLEHLADRGFTEFELMLYPGHMWLDESSRSHRQTLDRVLAKRGLRIISLNSPNLDLNIAGAAAETRALTISILSAIVDLAGDLGAGHVVMGPGKPNPLMPMPRRQLMDLMRDALDQLAPRAERAGTTLAVENMPVGSYPDADGLMNALDAHGDDRIGVVYDVANAHFIGENPTAGLGRVAPRLGLVHLADTGQNAYRHAAVGEGEVDFGSCASTLEQMGRRVPAVLEITSTSPDSDIAHSVERLLDCGWRDWT